MSTRSRRLAVVWAALAIVLASFPPGAAGHDEAGTRIDGPWGAGVCLFSAFLAKINPDFTGAQVIICMKALNIDPT